ncbi:MAG: hypothetical protein IAF00_05040 [Phycisphaerales bacterium]|nr:hypothetical protein [Phycisphaerales bacterium]
MRIVIVPKDGWEYPARRGLEILFRLMTPVQQRAFFGSAVRVMNVMPQK